MPYSPTLGLIYVAIPKTGTTSLTHALHDMEPAGRRLHLYKETISRDYRRKHRLDEIGDPKPGKGKHLSAIQIKYILGNDEFNRCLKFTLVRNPWARMVSRYYFNHAQSAPSAAETKKRGSTRKFHHLDFSTWITRRYQRHRKGKSISGQLSKLTDLEGKVLVDHIGRLESVQETLDWVCDNVGERRIAMPHVNGARRGHYAQFYNQSTREMVEEMCQEDIEFFNYRFEE
jgi:hypothetical protein